MPSQREVEEGFRRRDVCGSLFSCVDRLEGKENTRADTALGRMGISLPPRADQSARAPRPRRHRHDASRSPAALLHFPSCARRDRRQRRWCRPRDLRNKSAGRRGPLDRLQPRRQRTYTQTAQLPPAPLLARRTSPTPGQLLWPATARRSGGEIPKDPAGVIFPRTVTSPPCGLTSRPLCASVELSRGHARRGTDTSRRERAKVSACVFIGAPSTSTRAVHEGPRASSRSGSQEWPR
jgi:hypothetical protein